MVDMATSASLDSKSLMSEENSHPCALMVKNLKKSLKERPVYAKKLIMSVILVSQETLMETVFVNLRLKNHNGRLNHFKEKKNSVRSMDTTR